MEHKVCKPVISDPELDPKVAETRNLLFEKYVTPYLNMIYKLCIKYTYNPSNVKENYTEVLVNFYRSIETYDPQRSILTWLHIVTKRHVASLERKRKTENNRNYDTDIELYDDEAAESETGNGATDISNYRELYSDDVLMILESMKSIHRDPLLLQMSGYLLKEIVDIEFKKGTLKTRNIETIKSRLFFARNYMKDRLTRDGKRKRD
jgi:DNA-directed RNA polymerase specialized sigma24 family protein